MKIHYNPELKPLARELRNNSTLSEILLWDQLNARKMHGFQFMRQKPILNYIVDFYCSKLHLVVKIDGNSYAHEETATKDQSRQKEIENLGIHFIRFDDLDIKHNMPSVLRTIEDHIDNFIKNNPPTPFIKGE